MTPVLIELFNRYSEKQSSAIEVAHFLRSFPVTPMPDRVPPTDWRAHVPMPLIESWTLLQDEERLAIFVMALSATQIYEVPVAPPLPALN